MVFPVLIPVVAGIAGTATGAGIVSLLTKKQPATSYAPVNIPISTYSPVLTYAPQLSYGYQGGDVIISSPGAETKKESTVKQESKPTITPSWQIAPQVTSQPSTGVTSGTNMVYLVGIAAVALVAYGWVSKKK